MARYMIITQTEVVSSLGEVSTVSGSKGYGLKLIESAQSFTRNCLISLRAVEFWTLNQLHLLAMQYVYIPRINASRPPNTLGNVVHWITHCS